MKVRHLLPLFLGLGCLFVAPLSRAAIDSPDQATQTFSTTTLHIGKATLNTEIAATPLQMEQGLMFRKKLGDNDGMIFLLGHPQTATFWMKNTLIPLSVAFLDRNGVILEIHDMKALDQSITRSESDRVVFALETNLHWFSLNGIKPGDKITPPPGTLAPLLPTK